MLIEIELAVIIFLMLSMCGMKAKQMEMIMKKR